ECTMSQVDWDLLNKRRSCSLLARRALAQRGTPTTPTTASVIAGIQAQEAVKCLHGVESLLGRGFFFDGQSHNSYAVNYPINPSCGWHEAPAPIQVAADFDSATRLESIWERAAKELNGLDALDLSRELVARMECSGCGQSSAVLQSAEKISADQLQCRNCGRETSPVFVHSISAQSELLTL